jgi:hypothetical protein
MRFICSLMLILIFTNSYRMALSQEPKVTWFDDFLGIRVNPTYAISLNGTGDVKISEGRNGILALYTTGASPGTARVRLGEEPGNSLHNALNFSARKNLIYKARVFLNRVDNIQATVGLTGLNDPDNVLALVYDHPLSNEGWYFQDINEGKNSTIPIGFIHAPGIYFTVRIETELGETPIARVFINDETEPRATISGEYIPDGLCAEFQVWNRKLEDGSYSQPSLYVDYLSIVQDR